MNLDDDDLDSSVTEFPPEREGVTDFMFTLMFPPEKKGATDVMFTLMRCDRVPGGQKVGLPHLPVQKADGSGEVSRSREKAINEMEELFARKYMRYSDPTVPMQFCVVLIAKLMMGPTRLSAHRRR